MSDSMESAGGAAAVRIEDLLAESGWVRSLARSLVRDEQAADDVVQETWIAALTKPPRGDRPLRPWLARVVTNFARMQHRGEASRKRREGSVARPEALPSSDEMVERVEIHRKLAEAVSRLEEPLRTTVMLRYFAGLSSADIARRTETPAGTVRWRLKRGLEELREELDRSHEGRSGWMPAMVALAEAPWPAVAGPGAGVSSPSGVSGGSSWGLPGGGLVAATLTVLGLAGLLAVLATHWLGPGRSEAVAPLEPTEAAAVAAAASSESVSLAPDPNVARSASESAGRGVAGADLQPFVALRVVDARGRTLAARAVDAGGRSARTGASGRLELALEGGVHELSIESEGYVTHREVVHLPATGSVDLGELVLQRAGRIEGRVLDSAGRPRPGVPVAVEVIGSRWQEHRSQPLDEARYLGGLFGRGPAPAATALTDALGRFELDGLAPGFVRVWAGAVGEVADYSAPVVVRAGLTAACPALAPRPALPHERIAGRVVDELGRGVAGAAVEAGRRSVDPLFFQGEAYASVTVADALGRFELLVDPDAHYDVAALVDGGEASAPDAIGSIGAFGSVGFARDVAAGSKDLVVRLAARESVRLLLPAGVAPEDARVRFLDAERGRRLASTGSIAGPGSGSQATSGPTWLDFAVPLLPFELQVIVPGLGLARLGPFEPEDCPAELWPDFEAPAAGATGALRGRVLADGAPVSGARLALLVADGPRSVAVSLERGVTFVSDLRARPPLHRCSTDGEGRFRLPLPAPERPGGADRYALRVEAADGSGLAPRVVPLEAVAGTHELVVELDGGGRVEGVVSTGAEAGGTRAVVGLSVGDGWVRSARVDAGGAFAFEHVPAGTAQLRLLAGETRGPGWFLPMGRGRSLEPGEVPAAAPELGAWSVEVARGQTARVAIEAGQVVPPRVVGRLTIDGAAPGPWQVRLRALDAGDGRARASGTLDPSGHFELEAPGPGAYELELLDAGFEPVFRLVRDELTLSMGQRFRVDVDYATGTIEGRFGGPHCTDVQHRWRGDATLEVITRLEGDAEGRGQVRVPAGPGTVVSGGGRGRLERSVDVPVGGSLAVDY